MTEMSFKERYDLLRKVAGDAVNFAFVPLRLPGALFRFFSGEWTRYEQRRAWERNVKGTWLDPETREPWWTSIGEVIPDPRKHH
jgi:hypothetical protein